MEKLKAGWIGFIRPDDDFWGNLEKLSALGYHGMEGGEALLQGDAEENLKRFHDLGLKVLTVSADMDSLREGKYEDIIKRAKQLKGLGFSYDWSREVATSSPEYYKWTQWLFLQFYKRGMAYKKKSSVNWCPSCETVLANEQVVNGGCERCSTEVTKKELEQWFFRITEHAHCLPCQ
jgi:leucyl-tRNA synthetase